VIEGTAGVVAAGDGRRAGRKNPGAQPWQAALRTYYRGAGMFLRRFAPRRSRRTTWHAALRNYYRGAGMFLRRFAPRRSRRTALACRIAELLSGRRDVPASLRSSEIPAHSPGMPHCGTTIGAPGFEPGTFGSQSRRATGLRHTPPNGSRHGLGIRRTPSTPSTASRKGTAGQTTPVPSPLPSPQYSEPFPRSRTSNEARGLALLAWAQSSQALECIEPGVVPVAPYKLEGISAYIMNGRGVDSHGDHLGYQGPSSRHLVHAAGTGAIDPEISGVIDGDVPVPPVDPQSMPVFGGGDVCRGDSVTMHGKPWVEGWLLRSLPGRSPEGPGPWLGRPFRGDSGHSSPGM
jgi:hypothetical protein